LKNKKKRLLAGVTATILFAGLAQLIEKPVVAQNKGKATNKSKRVPFPLYTAAPTFSASWSVPAGKRYVLEQFSGGCYTTTASYITDVTLGIAAAGSRVVPSTQTHFFADGPGFSTRFACGTALAREYVDPGSIICISASASLQYFPVLAISPSPEMS
jgi:hypothetical protein